VEDLKAAYQEHPTDFSNGIPTEYVANSPLACVPSVPACVPTAPPVVTASTNVAAADPVDVGIPAVASAQSAPLPSDSLLAGAPCLLACALAGGPVSINSSTGQPIGSYNFQLTDFGLKAAATGLAVEQGVNAVAGIADVAVAGVGTLKSLSAAESAGAEAGTIRNVNTIGGSDNCVNCAVATDATLAGRPASALGGGPFRIDVLEKLYGTKFSAPTTIDDITSTIGAAGDGARGIVFGSRGTEVGHVFNVVNQGGVVRFLDGQTGKAATFDGFNSFQLLRTNK
jgi:hypothetical protein